MELLIFVGFIIICCGMLKYFAGAAILGGVSFVIIVLSIIGVLLPVLIFFAACKYLFNGKK
jgi:hypothetical protein